MGEIARKVGAGEFGDIYEGVKGQKTIDFLLKNKSGEVKMALSHPQIKAIEAYNGGGDKDYMEKVKFFADVYSQMKSLSSS